jgi:hypothetical protein
MDFNPSDTKYPEELIQSSFEREVRYLEKIAHYWWAPEQISINRIARKISFKWYGETCETKLPDSYKTQLEMIAKDLHHLKIYKPSFYPKYFYPDNEGKLHAYTFYSCSDYSEQPITMDFYKPILNEDRLQVVEQLSTDGKLDMKLLVERAFNDYIQWPDNPLPTIYKNIYG